MTHKIIDRIATASARWLLSCWIIAGAACPQPLPPVPPGPGPTNPDAAVVNVVRIACANLAALQCPEGLRLDCELVAQKALNTGITDLKLECLAAAKTADEARACGTVTCR